MASSGGGGGGHVPRRPPLGPALDRLVGRFMFERIHCTKEQIYFNERVENHRAKERMFKSFKWANFPGKHPEWDVEMNHWLLERDVGFALLLLSHLSLISHENETISQWDQIISFS